MPAAFAALARNAAEPAGFADFNPDVCLINRYEAGTRLSLHQDRDERDYEQPIVSVSLGVGAIFLFGGLRRSDRPRGCGSNTVMSLSGVDRRGCAITACCRSRRGHIR